MDLASNPIDIPPFQLQRLIADAIDHTFGSEASGKIQACSAQALGSEIYVGCSNGALLRFALQASDPSKLQSYALLSSQRVPGDRPIDEIVLIPSLSRALVLSANQIHFFSIPSFDLLPIKPIRHAITFAVDDHHLKIPPPSAAPAAMALPVDPVNFSVIKRTGVALYTLKERLVFTKDFSLPQINGTSLAKRAGKTLCIADKTNYHIVDLHTMTTFPLLPISQAPDPAPFEVKPSITVVGPNEFLLLSWTGTSTLGLFVTGNGDPVRGTLEWSNHPEAICLDYPYITSLLPNDTIQVHSIETQTVIQVISAASHSTPISTSPLSSPTFSSTHHRRSSSTSSKSVRGGLLLPPSRRVVDLISTSGGYAVPSTQNLDKIRKIRVPLLRS